GRAEFEHRLAVAGGDRGQMTSRLRGVLDGNSPSGWSAGTVARHGRSRVAFLFTGNGAQCAGMGKDLYDTQPAFRRALDACARALAGRLDAPLLDVLFESPLGSVPLGRLTHA